MTCRHAHAARARKVAHGPGERGHRRNLGIELGGYTVGSKNGGRGLNEELTVVAAVARDGNRGVLEILNEIFRKALGCTADRIDVHAVRAGAKRAAQACRAELEVLEERVGDSVFVSRFLHCLELGEQLVIRDIGDPLIEEYMYICHR